MLASILCALALLMTETPFACNLKALTAAERQRHGVLSKQLAGAVVEQRELPNGYAFRVATDQLSATELAEWVVFEQKCCPFFGFEIQIEPEKGPTWLRLTGRAGVKDFIRAELGLKK